MSSPWFDFLSARLRLIHEFHQKDGKSAEEITRLLNGHDVEQVLHLIETPIDDERSPGTIYTEHAELRDAAIHVLLAEQDSPVALYRQLRKLAKVLKIEQ